MIGYTLVGTNDLDGARAWYDQLFATVGANRIMDFPNASAWGVAYDKPAFGVCKPYDGGTASAGNGTMIAVVLDERAKVDTFYNKAIELGGSDEGAPGLRGDEGDQAFYAAYFRDPDGNKLCAFRVGPA